MTVILVLSNCPPKLRGDMTKWFTEINTGVYVGNVNARVRDEIWARVTENIGQGRATMVFSAPGREQHLDFYVHNALWEPIDYDGIKLMRRPDLFNQPELSSNAKTGFSNAAKRRMAAGKKISHDLLRFCLSSYVILDFETTGLDDVTDEIIEMGAILVERNKVVEKIQMLVHTEKPIPSAVAELTGITDEKLKREAIDEAQALSRLLEFIEDFPLVCHNAMFEQGFLYSACRRAGTEIPENRFIDTLEFAQILLPDLENHRLSTIARNFGLSETVRHRALPDCEMTYGIYCKLNELISSKMQNHT